MGRTARQGQPPRFLTPAPLAVLTPLHPSAAFAAGVPACSGYHGPAGAGIPAQFPRLAGQYSEYIAAQLKSFRDGVRANDANGVMRGVAARMTDREIKAVAEYAAGLR